MHYRGFEDAPDDREWQPEPLTLRRGLETRLRERVDIPTSENPFAKAFFTLVEAHEGPSLASFVQRESTTEQTLELLRHRSIYHLKESDSTAWVVHGSRSGRRSR